MEQEKTSVLARLSRKSFFARLMLFNVIKKLETLRQKYENPRSAGIKLREIHTAQIREQYLVKISE
jgi:hypothetical protein